MSLKLGTEGRDRLRDIGLFGGLSDEVLEQLATTLDVVVLEPGASVFKEGDSGREMFVLLEGEIEILKHSKSQRETRVALLGPNDWFGEMSILDVMPRSATVRTLSPSRVLRITAHDLDALYRRDLRSYSLVVLNIAREMSRRIESVCLRKSAAIRVDFTTYACSLYLQTHEESAPAHRSFGQTYVTLRLTCPHAAEMRLQSFALLQN